MIEDNTVNRNYKDDIFRYIFKNPEEFSKLYQDITGKFLAPEELELFDLESITLKEWRNDISFMTKDNKCIILVEEQSTLCRNMSIRCMVYYCELVKKFYNSDKIFKRKIYSKTSMKIPTPEFIVLYIGNEKLDYEKERLSEHFESNTNSMELVVEYQDIHYDTLTKKKEVHSNSLIGYSYLISRVTFYIQQDISPKVAFQKALEDCKSRNYLMDYADRKEFQIMGEMSLSIEELMEIRVENAHEEGIEKGKLEGQKEIIVRMKKNGMTEKEITELTGISMELVKELLS